MTLADQMVNVPVFAFIFYGLGALSGFCFALAWQSWKKFRK